MQACSNKSSVATNVYLNKCGSETENSIDGGNNPVHIFGNNEIFEMIWQGNCKFVCSCRRKIRDEYCIMLFMLFCNKYVINNNKTHQSILLTEFEEVPVLNKPRNDWNKQVTRTDRENPNKMFLRIVKFLHQVAVETCHLTGWRVQSFRLLNY